MNMLPRRSWQRRRCTSCGRASGRWQLVGRPQRAGHHGFSLDGPAPLGPSDARRPAVIKGLGYLERFLGPKGGLSEAPHSVYSTSVALMAFQEANKGGRYDRVIKGGQDFLKATQWDEGEGKGKEDVQYGGLGYGGGNSRPDLSNTAFFIEALRDTGIARG